MSTNRTKTDWAWRQAYKIIQLADTDNTQSQPLRRKIAAMLRRAERNGYRRGLDIALSCDTEPSTHPCSHGLTCSYQCCACLLDRQ